MTKVSLLWGQFINNSVTHNAYRYYYAQTLQFASVVCGAFTLRAGFGNRASVPEPALAGTRYFKRVEPRFLFLIWNRVEPGNMVHGGCNWDICYSPICVSLSLIADIPGTLKFLQVTLFKRTDHPCNQEILRFGFPRDGHSYNRRVMLGPRDHMPSSRWYHMFDHRYYQHYSIATS